MFHKSINLQVVITPSFVELPCSVYMVTRPGFAWGENLYNFSLSHKSHESPDIYIVVWKWIEVMRLKCRCDIELRFQRQGSTEWGNSRNKFVWLCLRTHIFLCRDSLRRKSIVYSYMHHRIYQFICVKYIKQDRFNNTDLKYSLGLLIFKINWPDFELSYYLFLF